jgi:hypothetical protein
MVQQPSREFASTDPPTRRQDARVQEPGLGPEISLNPRSHLQYLQRPTPSHFSQNTPSLSCVRYRQCGARQLRSLENVRGAEFSRSFFDNVTAPEEEIRGRGCQFGFQSDTNAIKDFKRLADSTFNVTSVSFHCTGAPSYSIEVVRPRASGCSKNIL